MNDLLGCVASATPSIDACSPFSLGLVTPDLALDYIEWLCERAEAFGKTEDVSDLSKAKVSGDSERLLRDCRLSTTGISRSLSSEPRSRYDDSGASGVIRLSNGDTLPYRMGHALERRGVDVDAIKARIARESAAEKFAADALAVLAALAAGIVSVDRSTSPVSFVGAGEVIVGGRRYTVSAAETTIEVSPV